MAKANISPGMQQYLDIKKIIQMLFCFSGWVTFMNYFMMMLSRQRNF